MNPLQRTIIEKTGNDNGFEHVVASDLSGVTLASAHHANRVLVGLDSGAYQVRFQTSSSALLPELQRSFPATQEADAFQVATEADLAALLRRAASLSRSLPSQAPNDYQQAVAAELAELPTGIAGTEVERMIRQRVGQNKFRDALMDYWGGACAVTGVAVSEVLRASVVMPFMFATSIAPHARSAVNSLLRMIFMNRGLQEECESRQAAARRRRGFDLLDATGCCTPRCSITTGGRLGNCATRFNWPPMLST
jgi:hypothetical protein